MTENREDALLSRLTAAAGKDHFFVGSRLATFQRLNAMNRSALAEYLVCDESDVDRLALCRAPDDLARSFRAEMLKIASYGKCDADRLIELMRRVAAVSVFSAGPSSVSAEDLLLAARDHKESKEPSDPKADISNDSPAKKGE